MRGLPALLSVLATLVLLSSRAVARDPLLQHPGAAAPAPALAPAPAPTPAPATNLARESAPSPVAASTEHVAAASASAAEIKEVEANLLALFGLKKRPRPNRSKVVVPEAMMELYRRQAGHTASPALALPGKLTRSANTVRSFTHIESPVDAFFSGSHRFRLAFDIASVPDKEALHAAELQLSRRPTTTAASTVSAAATTGAAKAAEAAEAAAAATAATTRARARVALTRPQRVLVHDVVRPGSRKHGRAPILRLLDSRLVAAGGNSSLALDVLPAVRRWREEPRRNHGLLVEVMEEAEKEEEEEGEEEATTTVLPASVAAPHVRLRRDLDEREDVWLPKQPVLIVYTDDGKAATSTSRAHPAHRTRRAAPTRKHHKSAKRENCRRYPLYVDFGDVGWNDWIVAPPGYDAFYCHGECPFPLSDHLNSTNHAIVQTLMHSVKPSVPQACCVPTALTSISMLYLDETDKVVLKNYQEMAVVGCGCR